MIFPTLNKYPKEIVIRKAIYCVLIVDTIKNNPRILGFCSRKHKIWIKKQASRKKMYDTFMHELLHAFEFEYNIKIKHKAVYQLAKAFTKYLKDNF